MLKDVILLPAAARGARGVVVTVLYTVFVTTTSSTSRVSGQSSNKTYLSARQSYLLVNSPLTK
jgi:hypothetical protein